MVKSLAKMTICLVMMLATSVPARGATVGYWEFDEKDPGQQADGTTGAILDGSGNNHHGTAVGVPLPGYVESWTESSSAIHLTSKGVKYHPDEDRIVVPNSTDFNLMLGNLQDYTIEAIVKNPTGAFISKRETTGAGWCFGEFGYGTPIFYAQGSGTNYTNPWLQGSITINDGLWHHVAVVIDANVSNSLTKATFYVDHVEDTTVYFTDQCQSGSWINENIVNAHDVWIGDFTGRPGDQMTGDIDAVRFSTGILTPAEFLPFEKQTLPPINIQHSGSADPTTEGFILNDGDASSTWTDAGTTPSAGRLQEVADSSANYQAYIAHPGQFSAQLASEEGWTATAVMKLNSNPDVVRNNVILAVDDGQTGWWLNFLSDSGTGDARIAGVRSYIGSGVFEEFALSTDVDPTSDFNTYQIVFDPEGDGGNGSVTYYVNGQAVGTQTRDQAYSTSLTRFLFGDNASTGSVASDSLWSLVTLETGQNVIVPGALPGDANNDGTVNALDAAILAENWLGSGGWTKGDFNGDGVINDVDAAMMAANWLKTKPSGSAVPEPGAVALLLGGLLGLAIWRYRH